jgi:hypothetical protein
VTGWNPYNWTPGEWMDFYICGILTIEYFFGRSDTDFKNEAKKKAKIRKEKHAFDELNIGEMR